MQRRTRTTKTLSVFTVTCLLALALPLKAVAGPNNQEARPNELINLAPQDVQALKDLLSACDETVQKGEVDRQVKAELIKQYQANLDSRERRVKELESKQDGLLSNPTFWFIVGMLTAGVTVHLVK